MRCILKPSIRIRRLVLFRDQPLIDYFKNYRTQHGLLQRADPNQCHSTINVRQEIRHDPQKTDFVHWDGCQLAILPHSSCPTRCGRILVATSRHCVVFERLGRNAHALHRDWERFPSFLLTDFKWCCHLRSEKEGVT